MDLIRALRILRHRWLIATAIILGTTSVAVATATYRNDSIEQVSRAEAPITFISDVADLDSGGNQGSGGGSPLLEIVQAQIEEARVRAVSVNADLLADPSNEIVADPALGKLTFIARGEDAAEAIATASEMRRRLITRQPVDMESQLREQLDILTERMDEVRADLITLVEEYSLPLEQAARRDRLTALLSQLDAQALDLEKQLLVPNDDPEPEKTPEELAAELETVNAAIETVQAELATIPTPLQEFSEEQTLRSALERQYRELEASYQELILQQAELSGPPVVELVDVFDESPDPISRRVAGGVALLLGGGLVLLILLVSEKLIRPVWFLEDIPHVPRLGSIPPRLPSPLPWYLQVGDSPRKAAIQTIRSSLRARARGRELVVGVCGAGVEVEAVHHLAADLAVSYASTQAGTALVNADFESNLNMPELDGAVLSIGFVATQGSTRDDLLEMVDDASDHHRSVHPKLTPVASGEDVGVPADALATPQLGRLFDSLRETQEVVIVICGDVDDPSTRAALDRTDFAVIVTQPGASTQRVMLRVTEEMSIRDIEPVLVMVKKQVMRRTRRLLAAILNRLGDMAGLLRKESGPAPDGLSRRPLRWVEQIKMSWLQRSATSSPQTVSVPLDVQGVDEEVDGSSPVPIVVVAASEARADGEVEGLDGDHPSRMLYLLESSDPADTVEAAESFLASWVTKIVEAGFGSGLDPVTIEEVRTSGFVPLAGWKDNPSLGFRLRHEFRRVLGRKDAATLERLLLRSLFHGSNMEGLESIDGWAERRYFQLHTQLTEAEPTVWHITSPKGTVSALIAAEHLDVQRIEAFVEIVVIRNIERLARRQRYTEMMGGNSNELEDQIEDARALGLSLAWLMDGSHDDARLWYPGLAEDQQPRGWYPDWHQGITHNIAPLQRLGIISVPVLTDQQLDQLDPTG